jgi:branched-chain amino acid transport system substrate-binding protein
MGQPDFSAEITQIRDLNPAPDVIMTAAWEPDFPSFLTQLRSAGIKTPVLGSNGIDSVTTTNLGPTAEGVVFTTSGHATPGSPMESFFKNYEAKFGKKTESGFAAQGYDLVQVLNAAVLAAGTTAGPALRDAISNLVDVQGATTKITYKGTNGVGYRAAALIRVHDGKKELIEMALPPREDIPAVR